MRNSLKRALFATLPVIGAVVLVADDMPEVKIFDDCQLASFNAAIAPGTCQDNFAGRTSFQNFIGDVDAHKSAAEWRFDPNPREVRAGSQLRLENRGGETHSFTRVNVFGGGFIDILNQLSGNPVPAAECVSQSVGSTFVPSGAPDQPGPTLL